VPDLTIHRREYALWTEDESYRCAVRVEYHFDPPPPGWTLSRSRRSDADLIHVYTALPPAIVAAPPGARLVERTPSPRPGGGRRPPELRCVWPRQSAELPGEEWGLDAEICYRLATSGEKGFSMGRRRQEDDGPTLFDGPEPAVGAYGPARRGGGGVETGPTGPRPDYAPDYVPAAFGASDVALDQVEALRGGIARALDQLRRAIDGDEPARVVTARAILEGLIEAPAGAGEAA
jgi:hypothetical protein